MTAKLSGRFEERADPKIQLEQAIHEVQDQHRRLVEQAAAVISNQKRTELQLNRAMDELERVHASTQQALRMAQEAEAAGDAQKAAEYNQTAEAFANRLVATENQINDLKTMSLQTAQASQAAQAAVSQNSVALQAKINEHKKLLSQLDQAKMQEQLNAAMGSLTSTVQADVPTLDQVRDKIEARYAKAIGTSELTGQTVEARMLEVEQAAMGSEARSRLDQMRQEMALGAGAPAGGALGPGSNAPDVQPEPDALGGGAAPGASSVGGQGVQPEHADQPAPE